MPSSCTVITTPSARLDGADQSWRRPPSGIARSPLVARFQTICLICPSSASYQSSAGGHVDVDRVPVVHLGAVPQQQRRVVERAPDVEPGDREPLRPRVRQKRSDRRVQPLGLAQHDVHQLLLLGAERQLLAQDLDRAGHRRERIADLVRDAGRHLADGREPLLDPRIALELLDVGHVLERHEKPGAPAGRLEMRRAQADVDLASPIGRSVAELEAAGPARRSAPHRAAATSGAGNCSTSATGRPTARLERQAGDGFGGAVEGQDPLQPIGGRQAARQAVDDVLIERLEIGDLGRGLLEPRPGRPHAVGQRAAQERDGEEAEQVQRHACTGPRQRGGRATRRGSSHGSNRSPAAAQVLRDSTRPT